ncbi:MAG: ECF-type sigma factor [Planctomycetota bacterium]
MVDPPEGATPEGAESITALLRRAREQDGSALDALLPRVYSELRQLAQSMFARQNPGHTLQATALLHEAWFKLNAGMGRIEDRHHFFALASRAMRQVLADHARARAALKRDQRRVTLAAGLAADSGSEPVDLLELNDALERLSENNARLGRVAELRVFGGLSVPEVAETLQVSERTAYADWTMAKAWLRKELGPSR